MSPAPGTLVFECNICGRPSHCQLDELERETPSCPGCNSSPRLRAIVEILAQNLLGQSCALPDFPVDRKRRGLGLTDYEGYASRLAEKFDYRNTYFHQPPRLDIAGDIDFHEFGACDFVISSEIFEHVAPPVSRAFENVFRLLKPGGLFLLTVPYGLQAETIEHFPELHDFTINEMDGRRVLTNRTRTGAMERFDDLIFHGGPGSTLEMRVFAENDLRQQLAAAGFTGIKIHHAAVFRYGIWWPQPWSRPISARRPA